MTTHKPVTVSLGDTAVPLLIPGPDIEALMALAAPGRTCIPALQQWSNPYNLHLQTPAHGGRFKAAFPANPVDGKALAAPAAMVCLLLNTAAFNVRCICRPKPTAEDFKAAFPLNPVDGKALAAPDADPTALQMVWVGHATMLVQMAGLTFLTDPVFSERCGQWGVGGG